LFAVDNAPLVVQAQNARAERIPVRVVARHPGWVQICREFQYFAKKLPGGQPYQPCTHIDLADQPSSWSERRFHIIRDCLSASGGRFLDIGANLGYFCHCAEDLGYDCLAVESCPRLAYFLERLRRAESRRFDVLCASVLDYPFHEPFDVVLALNIFHHFLKSEASYGRLIAMLGRMRMREMIFQSHKPGEGQMAGAFRDYTPEEFVQFLTDHSCLTSAEYLGSDRERPIYRLRAA
jgi:SAM-dependent methyltransferase